MKAIEIELQFVIYSLDESYLSFAVFDVLYLGVDSSDLQEELDEEQDEE